MQTVTTPTESTLKGFIMRLVEDARHSTVPIRRAFNSIELVADSNTCESDLISRYWQETDNRKVAYEEQCRLEYDQLVETVRGGVPLNSDQRMWIRNVEVILDVPPESSILLHPTK